jgi:hypothetical protein
VTASRKFGVLGIAKQSSVGTAAANPTYAMPVISGNMRPMKDTDLLPRNGTTQARLGYFTKTAHGTGSVTTLAHPAPLGLLLYEAMGTQAVSGAGPYTHTFTMSDDYPALPLTVWSKVGDSWWKFTDTYISKLALQGTTGENLQVSIDFESFTYGPSAAPTYTLETEVPRYKYIGSTTKLEANSATPVVLTNVQNVMWEVDRGPELRYGPSLTPTIITPDRMVNFSCGLTYDTTQQGWDFLEQAYTGTVGGGGSPDQGYSSGSFDITFGRHLQDAARSLQITGNGQNWQYTLDRPDAEVNPGVLDFDLTGIAVNPAGGGTETTVVLKNDVVAVY